MSISTRALGRTSLDGVMLVNYGTTGALEPPGDHPHCEKQDRAHSYFTFCMRW